ncbi:hypothetical protein RND71_002019 [Anisodus tanguticus]|uniref:Uncharacterized protein n=1 Tax=Anisodus tanguticus TaxID=243964 RepID=A0AAE1T1W3_9SOLA|nr:hypothetical protein RND71_002019 [Anisodus tanguticus]
MWKLEGIFATSLTIWFVNSQFYLLVKKFYLLISCLFPFQGAPNENLPYMYYTPNYGYVQSAYNPYNPYIPGAVAGVDGSYLGAQQYYTIPSYENNVSLPSYFPVVLPNASDVMVNRADMVIESNISTANRADGSRLKHNLSSASPTFTSAPLWPVSGHNNFNRGSESAKSNARSGNQPVLHGNIASDRFSIRPSEVHVVKFLKLQEVLCMERLCLIMFN